MDDIDAWHAYIDEHRDVLRETGSKLAMLAYFYGIWWPGDGDWFDAPICDPMENVL